MTQAPKHNTTWLPLKSVPQPLATSHFVLEPLNEHHAEVDFEAFTSCRLRLRKELQWGEWPPANFTLDANRADLRDHYGEFSRGEAFAYTVLSVDRERCLGCIYLERCTEIDGAQLAYWVIDDAIEAEEDLVASVLHWIHNDWSIQRVLIPLRTENPRGLALAKKCAWSISDRCESGPLAKHLCFLSESR